MSCDAAASARRSCWQERPGAACASEQRQGRRLRRSDTCARRSSGEQGSCGVQQPRGAAGWRVYSSPGGARHNKRGGSADGARSRRAALESVASASMRASSRRCYTRTLASQPRRAPRCRVRRRAPAVAAHGLAERLKPVAFAPTRHSREVRAPSNLRLRRPSSAGNANSAGVANTPWPASAAAFGRRRPRRSAPSEERGQLCGCTPRVREALQSSSGTVAPRDTAPSALREARVNSASSTKWNLPPSAYIVDTPCSADKRNAPMSARASTSSIPPPHGTARRGHQLTLGPRGHWPGGGEKKPRG